MTKNEYDSLKVGDLVIARLFNCNTEKMEWTLVHVSNVYVCTNGGMFTSGCYSDVWVKTPNGHRASVSYNEVEFL